jgi:hypothetical protein
MELFLILLIVLLVILMIATVPAWPYSRDWGYNPAGLLAAVLAIVLVAWLFMGGLPGGSGDPVSDGPNGDTNIEIEIGNGDDGNGGNGEAGDGESE